VTPRPRLVEVARSAPAPVSTSSSLELVHVPTEHRCPQCDGNLELAVWAQAALFLFGGEGQTTEYRYRWCLNGRCRWVSALDEHARSPRS